MQLQSGPDALVDSLVTRICVLAVQFTALVSGQFFNSEQQGPSQRDQLLRGCWTSSAA